MKFFSGFNLFRKSKKRNSRATQQSVPTQPAVEVEIEEEELLEDMYSVLTHAQLNLFKHVVDNADIARIHTLEEQDIDVDTVVEFVEETPANEQDPDADPEMDYETVGTYAVKAMHQHTMEEIEAAQEMMDMHTASLGHAASVIEIAQDSRVPIEMTQLRMRAAYFAKQQDFLERYEMPQDVWPNQVIDEEAMADIAAESTRLKTLASARLNSEIIMSRLFGIDEQDYDNMNELNKNLAEKMQEAESNYNNDTPYDLFRNHSEKIEHDISRTAANDLSFLAGFHEKHKNALPTQDELKAWAKDPVLQEMPMVLELCKRFDIQPYTPEEKAQMDRELDDMATERAGYILHQDVAMDTRMMQVICESDMTQLALFENKDVHPDTLLGLTEDGQAIGETVASVATKTYRALSKQRDAALDALDAHEGTLNVIENIKDMDDAPDRDIEYQRATALLSHQSILEALNVPKDQWPENHITREGSQAVSAVMEMNKKVFDARYMVAHVVQSPTDPNFSEKLNQVKPNMYGEVPAAIFYEGDVLTQKMNMVLPDKEKFDLTNKAISFEVNDALSEKGIARLKQQVAEWKGNDKIAAEFGFLAHVNEQEIKAPVASASKIELNMSRDDRKPVTLNEEDLITDIELITISPIAFESASVPVEKPDVNKEGLHFEAPAMKNDEGMNIPEMAKSAISYEAPTQHIQKDIEISVEDIHKEAYEQFESFDAPKVDLNYTIRPRVKR